MRYLLLCLAFSALVPATFAAEEQTTPISEFMKLARNPYPVSSYAALEGEVRHLRRGGRPETVPFYFGIILQPERMTGQIILDGREGYMLGQTRRSGSSETTVVPMKSNTGDAGSENRLGHMGIRPSDLTMSFLYYPVVRELESESVRTVPCRVVLLESPDKKEQVKVYIARDYHFPLKAEFFEGAAAGGTPFRTLEINSFRKSDGFYYTDRVGLFGPGWRTSIEFDKSAAVGKFDPARPPKVIRPLAK